MQIKITLSLPVEVVKKKKWYVATCAALDVVSQGDTPETAKAHLQGALMVFLESCLDRGVLEEVLQECGFMPVPSGEPGPRSEEELQDTVDIPPYQLTKYTDSNHCRRAQRPFTGRLSNASLSNRGSFSNHSVEITAPM